MSLPQLTAEEIIEKFELQVNDLTELSTDEELDLLNEIYILDICGDRPWEFLKTQATGALTFDNVKGLWSIPLPSDFSYLAINNQYTDNTIDVENNASPTVIFVGANFQPMQVVNFSDRAQYRTHSAICWVDVAAKKIYFAVPPADTSFYQFDYIKIPPLLALGDFPIFPGQFHKMIAYAMATDNDILQLSAAATSREKDNFAKFQNTFDAMSMWNASLQQN